MCAHVLGAPVIVAMVCPSARGRSSPALEQLHLRRPADLAGGRPACSSRTPGVSRHTFPKPRTGSVSLRRYSAAFGVHALLKRVVQALVGPVVVQHVDRGLRVAQRRQPHHRAVLNVWYALLADVAPLSAQPRPPGPARPRRSRRTNPAAGWHIHGGLHVTRRHPDRREGGGPSVGVHRRIRRAGREGRRHRHRRRGSRCRRARRLRRQDVRRRSL